MKDLVILTADKNTEFLLKGLLPRLSKAEHISAFETDIYVHTWRDAGVMNNAHDFLRPFSAQYHYAMVIFDHEGCGKESLGRDVIEKHVEEQLDRTGWNGRCAAIVISPEVENWIWVHSSHVANAIGWKENQDIYEWLHSEDWKNLKATSPYNLKKH